MTIFVNKGEKAKFLLFSLFRKMWLIDAGNYPKVLKTDILSFSVQKNVEIPNEAMRL